MVGLPTGSHPWTTSARSFFVLLLAVAGLAAVAKALRVPYPIPLVVGGIGLGLVPGMPSIELDPDLVLLLFLPSLLYSAAFFSSLCELRANDGPRSRCCRSASSS